MKKIILFASGGGSNAEQIIKYAELSGNYTVAGVFTNKPQAGVLQKAAQYNVPAVVFTREEMEDGALLKRVNEIKPDLIVLAGFLWKFPADIITNYPNKVVNIHPALLPNYGGKGMYGMNVHRAVHTNKEKESGITIHYVNNNYDEGNIIFQQVVNVENCQSPEEVAQKVLALEHEHFPKVITQLLNK
ncbi:phosphoribosylglycinamide formyltransferase [Flavobacterium suaedae]|uniref:Phosphoribosylglycinamide formyltransferase n=1 Tax=Flavobacterium suaedae TaxID=1767027 RepID=A0ABQ1K511_9FLAO|nr:phosphoribosylglycinamide formyltransferase [Flavobacterium suaedae]GGB84511.1 phosphoribosylglycinamide formyltransferase [Flavobacterium suaedae]